MNLFAKAYGGASSDRAYSIIQTTDGGFAVAGMTETFGAGFWDCLAIKLYSDGNLDWIRTYGASNYEVLYSIIQTTDGGFALAGWTYSFGAGYDDFLIIKLNSNGSISWARTFGGTSADYAYSIIQTTDGGFAVAGWTYGVSAQAVLIFSSSSWPQTAL